MVSPLFIIGFVAVSYTHLNVLVLRKNLIQNRPERVLFQYIYDYFKE